MCTVDSSYRRTELSSHVKSLFFVFLHPHQTPLDGGGVREVVVAILLQNPSHSWWASSMLLGRLRYGGTHTHTAAAYISRKGLQRGVQPLALGQTEDWRGYAGAEWGETGGEGVTTYLCSIITSKLAHTHRSGETCSWPSGTPRWVCAEAPGHAGGEEIPLLFPRKSIGCVRLIEETQRRFGGEEWILAMGSLLWLVFSLLLAVTLFTFVKD